MQARQGMPSPALADQAPRPGSAAATLQQPAAANAADAQPPQQQQQQQQQGPPQQVGPELQPIVSYEQVQVSARSVVHSQTPQLMLLWQALKPAYVCPSAASWFCSGIEASEFSHRCQPALRQGPRTSRRRSCRRRWLSGRRSRAPASR
jgi:hypothetical protein